MADFASWMEQGPTTTSRRSLRPLRMSSDARRERVTKSSCALVSASSFMNTEGDTRSLMSSMRRSSVRCLSLMDAMFFPMRGSTQNRQDAGPCKHRVSCFSFQVSGFRSEEHTSELQSRRDLVCRLLLEKKKTIV